jgi:single-stranded-DNA-specific exonuclease
MDEFLKEKVSIVYTVDCGTTSFSTLNNIKYSVIDIIIIDHHISETKFPNIYSLINPNRYDENSEFKNLAAVGVTFLFLMALRKTLRKQNFFKFNKEPNLLSFLDFVALGTVCDVVPLKKINRTFVFKGLEIIRLRKSKAIATILDNSNLKSVPKADDLGYIIGPQINAASRLGDSTLPTKILVSKDINEIDKISRKLTLLNEKRKLIENQIYNEALNKINNTKSLKFILIHEDNWHSGVLGIVASRLLKQYYKPTIIISFHDNIGVGSARSIENINLGNIILEAKNEGLLISGGGHSKAAGFKIEKNKLNSFNLYLDNVLKNYDEELFEKKVFYTDKLSLNQIQLSLLDDLQQLEPFGNGNEEPNFIFTDIKIESVKKIKEKHNLVFFKNDFDKIIKGICFNSVNTIIGDYLEKYRQFNFEIAGVLKEDNYKDNSLPQIIIKDLMLLN